ncbi:MAG: c-type cytochrome [Alteraurantiacibacter sp.]
MRIRSSLAAASVLVLALAACGPAEESGDDVGVATPAASAAPSAAASASPAPSASASAAATPSPSATPSAAASVAAAAPAAPATAPAAFAQCGVCHSVQRGQNGIGPSLAGVVGRHSGSLAGFTYTDGMKNLNVTWNDANLNRYLSGPSAMVPGTTMAIGPLNASERSAIIAYLKTL